MATLNDRIGDIERDRALQALGVHFAQGRIGLDEYEKRSDLAMDSRTRAELDALFLDLPTPHYNRGLATRVHQQERMAPAQTQVVTELDPWDQPIGNSSLTLRKVRKIGWLMAFAWIPLVGPIISAIMPYALEGLFTFAPLVAMLILSIVMKPNVPRYRVVAQHRDNGRYPY